MPLQSRPIISRDDILKQRSTVPVIAEKLAESLDKVFVKILAGATVDFINRLKRWWAHFAESRPEGQVPREITRDAQLPALPIFLAFVQHQALCTRGRISEYAVKGTIKTQMHSLFSLWRREALQPLPRHYTQQVLAYIDSQELHDIAPLSTESKPKHTLTAVDFEILVRGFFQDPGFRTTRMSLQMAYLISLQFLMTERPGALVEGSKYRNTDRAILWNEHEWHVVPNPENPRHPHVYIRVQIHRLKGLGSNQSAFKEFILYPEPNSNRAYCPFSMATAMALEDGIFAHVTTAEEIFHPAIPPTDHHILTHRPSASTQCAVRGEILDDNNWKTSLTRALTYDAYNGHLRRVSLYLGFILVVTGYCARRGASNRLSGQLSEQDLRTLMGHTKRSDMFDTSYKSKFIDKDLGAILHNRTADENMLKIGSTALDMSARRDTNAPRQLSVEACAELFAEEELVTMRNTRAQLAEELATISKTDQVTW
ncbi:uncharacterized protein EV420DRAFT_507035 [Desarmillaria tabescens]|uniref:Uncharacterized protein n=1 Tax=Armillaria tabescens TaxID=1929756 RepID=A0AA39MH78_ARMTA|nr:uncharacterized protein EV420DRAFT_507035 [Desarmillaria tabescens]KAK0433743.1 hypothetical protein EV420DRAFT_507035 [Desarmillaria tabescens]